MITMNKFFDYRYISTTLFNINNNSKVLFSVSPIRNVKNSKQLFYNEYNNNGITYATINIDWMIRIVYHGNINASFCITPSDMYHFITALHKAVEWCNNEKYHKLYKRNKINGLIEINKDIQIDSIKVFNMFEDYMELAPAIGVSTTNERYPAIGFYFNNNLEGVYMQTHLFLSFVYLMDKLDPYNLAINILTFVGSINSTSTNTNSNINNKIDNSNFFSITGAVKKND